MKTQVLIAGAGPTGLMMACQLQRWGVDFIIIDNKETVTENSKALAVQARSVELFRQMGIADEAVKRGSMAKALNMVVRDKVRGHIAFGNIGEGLSPYPFILMLEQSKNEALMNEYIQQHEGKVLWKHELLDFVDGEKGVTANVRNAEGQTISIQAHYMVGADGAKSHVRHILDLPFEGGTYEHVFFVADTKVNWKQQPDELYIVFSLKTFSAFFPMSGESRYRLVGTMPEKFTDDGSVTFKDIEETVRAQMDIPVTFSDTSWFSIYRVHHRVAGAFRKGSVFLAGDAAHVHSPIGAQGMNTGLQDAYNLAWKMAWSLKGIADSKLLDSYNEERHAVATKLVATTDRLFSIVNGTGWWARTVKFRLVPFFAPILMRLNSFKRKVFKLASQIAVKYPDSPISSGYARKVKAGMRFPYFKWKAADSDTYTDSFELFKNTGLYVVTYGLEEIQLQIPPLVDCYRLDIPVNEANAAALKKAGFSKSFICIVRPDCYIGYAKNKYEAGGVKEYLAKQLGIITH
jgi:2-polyprenyl-6-methoxyphenol hydroxylase-like FAD-dependent oxidoreductase